MKKFFLALFFLSLTYTAKSDVGFGLMFGDPTAVTVKSRSGGANDLIFNLGFVSHYGAFRLDGIYTFNFPDVINHRDFTLYAGVGGVLGIGDGDGFFQGKHKNDDDNDLSIGAKGLFGLNFTPSKQFEIFLEVGPLISLTPGIGTDMEGSLGFRFYP
jgi:hypothetical protein